MSDLFSKLSGFDVKYTDNNSSKIQDDNEEMDYSVVDFCQGDNDNNDFCNINNAEFNDAFGNGSIPDLDYNDSYGNGIIPEFEYGDYSGNGMIPEDDIDNNFNIEG